MKIKSMTFFKQLFSWVLVAASIVSGPALAQKSQALDQTILAKVEGARIPLHSKALGFSINVEIVLPQGYSKDSTAKYPVIFLMDSQWKLMPFMYTYGVLAYEKKVPQSIVVGINADTNNGPWANNVDQVRSELYTPTQYQPHAPNSPGGNADKLLDFFKVDVIPYLNKNYNTLPDRTLIGSSIGGLFGLYALLQDEPLFQRYVLSSPSVYWGDNYIKQHEANYFKTHKFLKAKVFMGVGSEELTLEARGFSNQLITLKYKNLDYQFHHSSLGHVSNDIEINARGLQFVFATSLDNQ